MGIWLNDVAFWRATIDRCLGQQKKIQYRKTKTHQNSTKIQTYHTNQIFLISSNTSRAKQTKLKNEFKIKKL